MKKILNLESKSRTNTQGLEVAAKTEKNYFLQAGIPESDFALIINSGTTIKGELNVTGTALIEGEIHADIFSDGLLVIGSAAKIIGNINCNAAIIFGSLEGDIQANEKLILCSPANIQGSICSNSIGIQEGVSFQGQCRMLRQEQVEVVNS